MPQPSAADRAALDRYMEALAKLLDGLTLDDFREAQIAASIRTARRVKVYIFTGSVFFLSLAFAALFSISYFDNAAHSYDMLFASAWAASLGGLGAISSIFLHILKLVPQTTLKSTDEFEVIGRIVLGCLFATIFALTLAASPIIIFFNSLHFLDCSTVAKCKLEGGPILLLPFLAGYSITLVLGLLEKAIRAVELTIGIEDRREASGRRRLGRGR